MKTPLELTENILENNNLLLELDGISKSLLYAVNISGNPAVKEELLKSLAYRVSAMSLYASNIYWGAAELKRVLTAELEAEDPELAQDEEVTENDLEFLDEEEK